MEKKKLKWRNLVSIKQFKTGINSKSKLKQKNQYSYIRLTYKPLVINYNLDRNIYKITNITNLNLNFYKLGKVPPTLKPIRNLSILTRISSKCQYNQILSLQSNINVFRKDLVKRLYTNTNSFTNNT